MGRMLEKQIVLFHMRFMKISPGSELKLGDTSFRDFESSLPKQALNTILVSSFILRIHNKSKQIINTHIGKLE
jgi:hypothetical protein